MQHLFLPRFNVRVVDAGLYPPPASLPQALSHLVCLLLWLQGLVFIVG